MLREWGSSLKFTLNLHGGHRGHKGHRGHRKHNGRRRTQGAPGTQGKTQFSNKQIS